MKFPSGEHGRAEKTETISALQFKRGRVIRRRHTNAIKPGYPDKKRKRLIAASHEMKSFALREALSHSYVKDIRF